MLGSIFAGPGGDYHWMTPMTQQQLTLEQYQREKAKCGEVEGIILVLIFSGCTFAKGSVEKVVK
jgi:hypothetical protein